MKQNGKSGSLTPHSDTGPIEKGMHPLIARIRSGLREPEQKLLDELYSEAEGNIETIQWTVDFVTDFEKILFALLLAIFQKVVLLEERVRGGF